MTRSGRREFSRRILVLGALISGLLAYGWSYPLVGVALLVVSVVVYIYLPAVPPPADALVYDAPGSQTIPDWMGFILSSLFFSFPVWAAISEPNWGTIHPSSVMLWPMALLASSFWIIGALYASYWIVIKPGKLIISSAFLRQEIPFKSIAKVRPYRKGLPKWIYYMMPLLLLGGRHGAAGSLMLVQDRTGIELVLKDGKSSSIADSGYGEEIIMILQALEKHGVKMAVTYQKRLKRFQKRKR